MNLMNIKDNLGTGKNKKYIMYQYRGLAWKIASMICAELQICPLEYQNGTLMLLIEKELKTFFCDVQVPNICK